MNALRDFDPDCGKLISIVVSSTTVKRVSKIRTAMSSNGFPRPFTEKAISRQTRKRADTTPAVQPCGANTTPEHPWNVTIPFIDGLSQTVRRIARAANVRCVFRTPQTLRRSVYSAKDKLPVDTETHSVYSIKCETCSDEYIGETKRALQVRRKEHQAATRLGQCEKSAIAEHAHNQTAAHDIDWKSIKIIDKGYITSERKVREAIHKQTKKPAMNKDAGVEFSPIWNKVLLKN